MTNNPLPSDRIVLPALLRAAQRTFRNAIHQELAAIDCDDIPRNGIYLLGGSRRTGLPFTHLIKELGISKQAASQLVDVLVLRGYIERVPDAKDRRRVTLRLSARGELAAEASGKAVDRIESLLTERVGAEIVGQGRAMLEALIVIGDEESDFSSEE